MKISTGTGQRHSTDLQSFDAMHRLQPDAPPWLTRVRLSRYRSIVSCDVELGSLAILVGPNGSGKSNFLDALSLIADSVSTSLEQALGKRGGFGRLLHQPAKPADELEIVLDFRLPSGPGRYRLALGTGPEDDEWRVTREECLLFGEDGSEPQTFFAVHGGTVTESSFERPPTAAEGGLYLTRVSSIAEFGVVGESLSRMRFFDFYLGNVPRLIEQEPSLVLALDGRNLAAVVNRLQIVVTSHSPDLLEHEELGVGSLVAVEAQDGITCLGQLDEFGHSVLNDRLTTPGELQRQNQLRPEGAVANQ